MNIPRYGFISEHTTVAEMIEQLKLLPQNAQVRAWDADSQQPEVVTGYMFHPDANVVEFYTDEP